MANTGITIRVIHNRLPAIPPQLATLARTEVERTARLIEADAKSKAPVRTGTLRRSIHTLLQDGGLRALVGPSVLYGKFVEFGTRRMAARPYMRPAAEKHLPQFVSRLAAALRGLR